jgi:protein-tyrosine phosphatase
MMADEPATAGGLGDRVLPMEGIDNFRDYGGYAAGEGARVRRNLLWRSGQHADATVQDLVQVAALKLATVIDLRGDVERSRAPCSRPEGFAAEVLFAPGETSGLRGAAVHEESASQVVTADDARAAMVRSYAMMPWRPVLVGSYRLLFQALAERRGASLLHCFAGKDRTGLAAALVHHLLGVHPDDAMADYLLTNSASAIERRLATYARRIRTIGGGQDLEAVRTLMSVEPSYLDAAFASIRERHSTIDAYLEEVLEVSPQRREQVRANLLD